MRQKEKDEEYLKLVAKFHEDAMAMIGDANDPKIGILSMAFNDEIIKTLCVGNCDEIAKNVANVADRNKKVREILSSSAYGVAGAIAGAEKPGADKDPKSDMETKAYEEPKLGVRPKTLKTLHKQFVDAARPLVGGDSKDCAICITRHADVADAFISGGYAELMDIMMSLMKDNEVFARIALESANKYLDSIL